MNSKFVSDARFLSKLSARPARGRSRVIELHAFSIGPSAPETALIPNTYPHRVFFQSCPPGPPVAALKPMSCILFNSPARPARAALIASWCNTFFLSKLPARPARGLARVMELHAFSIGPSAPETALIPNTCLHRVFFQSCPPGRQRPP